MLARPSVAQAGVLGSALSLLAVSAASWKARSRSTDFIEGNLKSLLPASPSLELRAVAESYAAAGFAPGVLFGLSFASALFCIAALMWLFLRRTKGGEKDQGDGGKCREVKA